MRGLQLKRKAQQERGTTECSQAKVDQVTLPVTQKRLVYTHFQELFFGSHFASQTSRDGQFSEGKRPLNCAIPNASHVITQSNGQYHTGVTTSFYARARERDASACLLSSAQCRRSNAWAELPTFR